jgi:hypothetical protein
MPIDPDRFRRNVELCVICSEFANSHLAPEEEQCYSETIIRSVWVASVMVRLFAVSAQPWVPLARIGMFSCLWLTGTQFAFASCGDYLDMAGHSVQGMDHVPSHGPTNVPCRGPGCRRSTPPLAPPAPAPVELTTDQWAALAVADHDVPPLPPQRVSQPSVHAFAGHPSRLERPPRFLLLAA